MKNYMLPLGVDADKIINPLTEAMGLIDKVGDISAASGKVMSAAFTEAGKPLDKINDKLKPVERSLDAVRLMGRQAGKELADAFNDRKVNPANFEKAIDGFRSKLASLDNLQIKLPDDKMQVFEQQLENTKNEVEQLQVAMAMAAEAMNMLDPDSQEYRVLAENMEFLDAALTEYSVNVEKTEEKQVSLRAELRKMSEELNRMKAAGLEGSEAYQALFKEAANLTDELADTKAALRSAGSDTAVFDGLISGAQGLMGGLTAAQGAVAMFAGENEDMEKILVKVTSSMAILQGLQAVGEALNKDSAFAVNILSKFKKADVVATEAQTAATGAQTLATRAGTIAAKGFGLALKAMGIGLIIGLIAYLVVNWDKLRGSLDKLLPAGMKTAKMFDTIKEVGMGVGNVLLQFVIAPFKILEKLLTEGLSSAIDQAKQSYNAFENFEAGKRKQQINNALNQQMELKKIRMQEWKNRLDIEEAGGKDVSASREKWMKNDIEIKKREGEEYKESEQELKIFRARNQAEAAKAAAEAAKAAAENRKRAAEEQRRATEEAEKAAAEEAKRQAAMVEKFAREATKVRIEAMQEGAAKERAMLEEETRIKIEDLMKEEAKTAAAIQARADLIAQIKKDATAKGLEIDAREQAEKIKLELEFNKQLFDIAKEGEERDIKLSEISHAERMQEIAEQYKDNTEYRLKLEAAETARFEREKRNITANAALERLDEEQKVAELLLELTANYAGKSLETEEQKQLGLLQISLEYAKKRRAALIAAGALESDILGVSKMIAEIEKQIDGALKKGKKFDLFKLMGFGDISEEKKNFIINTGKEMLQNISAITEGMIENYQMQIDKKQEVIDQIDNEIADLEDKLDEEKELRDAGFANNVEIIEKELAAKQAEKDEEIRQQKELQAKKLQLQRAQMIAETAMQLVGMVSASVNIFQSATEQFGLWGVPIAIAATAAMLGAFIAAKANAFQAINAQQKMRKGGWIGGDKTHESGGKKYYSEDGDGYELERDEFVMRVQAAQKYPRLLEAMNDENFAGLTLADVGVKELFRNLGLNFNNDELYGGLETSNEANRLQNINVNVTTGGGEQLQSIDKNIRFLAQDARNRESVSQEGGYTVIRKGIRKTRIKND